MVIFKQIPISKNLSSGSKDLVFFLFIITVWNTMRGDRMRLLIPLQIYSSTSLSGQVAPTNFTLVQWQCKLWLFALQETEGGFRAVHIFFISLKITIHSVIPSSWCTYLDAKYWMPFWNRIIFKKVILFSKLINYTLGKKFSCINLLGISFLISYHLPTLTQPTKLIKNLIWAKNQTNINGLYLLLHP